MRRRSPRRRVGPTDGLALPEERLPQKTALRATVWRLSGATVGDVTAVERHDLGRRRAASRKKLAPQAGRSLIETARRRQASPAGSYRPDGDDERGRKAEPKLRRCWERVDGEAPSGPQPGRAYVPRPRRGRRRSRRARHRVRSRILRPRPLEREQSARGDDKAQIDVLKAQAEQTRSSLRGDEANLNYTKIYAPMSGTVVSQSAKQGQTLNANQQAPIVLRIADLSTMTVQSPGLRSRRLQAARRHGRVFHHARQPGQALVREAAPDRADAGDGEQRRSL